METQLRRIQQSEPDLLFAPSYSAEAIQIAQQARVMGIDVQLIGGDTWGDPELLHLCGESCNQVIFSTHYAPDMTHQVAQNFVQQYQENYGAIPDDIAALTYDAFQLLFTAIQNAQSFEKPAIREGLDQIDRFKGVTGTMRFGQNGDPQKCAVIVRIVDESFQYFDQACPPDFP